MRKLRSHRLLYCLVFIFVMMALPYKAISRGNLRFLSQTHLPNSGITLKLMPHAMQMPLPRPEAVMYSFKSSTGTISQKEMFLPLELWKMHQHQGLWIDRANNKLALAIIKYPLPENFKFEHVSKDEYSERVQAITAQPVRWNESLLAAWAGSFLQAPQAKASLVRNPPFKFRHLVSFLLPQNDLWRFAYAFLLNPNAAGQRLATDHWFFLYVEADKSLDYQRTKAAVERELLESITVPPMSASHKVEASSIFQRAGTTGLLSQDDKSDEYQESKSIVKRSIANLKDWWFVETDRYIILSNLSRRHRGMVADLQGNVEYLRSAYEQIMPPAKAITAVSVIRVPGSGEEYTAYVGPRYAWTAGLWTPSRKELVIRPVNWGGSREQKSRIMEIAYHEAFHQYLFYALEQTETCPWFNEGHATFFEKARISGKDLIIDEHELFAGIMENAAANNSLNLGRVIPMSYHDFYDANDETRQLNYATAWGLIYFLRKYASLFPDSSYAGIIDRYYNSIIAIRNPKTATQTAFEEVNIQRLDMHLTDFWKSRKMRTEARQNHIFRKR